MSSPGLARFWSSRRTSDCIHQEERVRFSPSKRGQSTLQTQGVDLMVHKVNTG